MLALRLYVVVILTAFNVFKCSGQIKDRGNLKDDLSIFVSKVKDNGNEYSNRYIQLVFRVYTHESPKENKICIRSSYIMNSYELKNCYASHFLILNNDTLLFNIPENIHNHYLKNLNLKPLNKELYLEIEERLFPKEHGGFTYRPEVSLDCYRN